MKIDELWQQLCAAPADEDLRRVLGDALLDAGDPRGELIQLQLLEHQTAEVIERADALIAQHWYRWLGDVADVLDRDATYFRNGFLDEITVRGNGADLSRIHDERELHTVRAVRPGFTALPYYMQFVENLPYEPIMLELRDPTHARTWSVRGLCVRFWADVPFIAASFPLVEQIELSPLDRPWIPARVVELVGQLPELFPRLSSIILDCRVPHFWYPNGDPSGGEALLAQVGRSPLVTLRR